MRRPRRMVSSHRNPKPYPNRIGGRRDAGSDGRDPPSLRAEDRDWFAVPSSTASRSSTAALVVHTDRGGRLCTPSCREWPTAWGSSGIVAIIPLAGFLRHSRPTGDSCRGTRGADRSPRSGTTLRHSLRRPFALASGPAVPRGARPSRRTFATPFGSGNGRAHSGAPLDPLPPALRERVGSMAWPLPLPLDTTVTRPAARESWCPVVRERVREPPRERTRRRASSREHRDLTGGNSGGGGAGGDPIARPGANS